MSDVEAEINALQKLQRAADTGMPVFFTQEEAAILQRLARTLLGFEALGRVAALLRKILAYMGWMFAAYLAFKSGFFGWLRGNL